MPAGSAVSAGGNDGIKRTSDQMSQITSSPIQADESSDVISFTPINANSRLICPYKDCHRNTCSPKRTFARADNLGSHLRNVHGVAVPARARVRKWIGLTNLPSTNLNNINPEKIQTRYAYNLVREY